MSQFVLDCSVAMAWGFGDQATSFTNAVRDSLVETKAIVPSIWPLEVVNVLLVAERRKKLTKNDSTRFLALLKSLPIEVDDETSSSAFSDTLAIARQWRLFSCDAAYLELAIRRGLPLATLDKNLLKAAKKVNLNYCV